jgi:hypothetical protein
LFARLHEQAGQRLDIEAVNHNRVASDCDAISRKPKVESAAVLIELIQR